MRFIRRFFSHWQNWLGILLVLIFILVAATAPWLSPMDQKNPGIIKIVGRSSDRTPHPPDREAWLGTLPGQVDIYHTLIWGTRDALQFGLLVALGTFGLGLLFGAISGYAGGLFNNLMMRIADAFLTFPLIAGVAILQQFVALTIESMGGTYYFNTERFGKVVYFEFTPPGWTLFLMKVDPLLICLILLSWVPIARLVNTLVILLKNSEFIQASRALGGGSVWIVTRHLIPNSIGPALVLAARDVGNAVILQATFTFIGIGSSSPWGTLLSMGRNWVIGPGGNLFGYWWVFMPVTLVVITFGLAWNLIGDGVNDAFGHGFAIPFNAGEAEQTLDTSAESLGVLSQNSLLGRIAHESMIHGKVPNPPQMPVAPIERAFEPGLPGSNPSLQPARSALARGDLSRALHSYSQLIENRRDLDEVIHDLAAVARQYPGKSEVWIVLGDALARNGRQEYALKAYEQAKNSSHRE